MRITAPHFVAGLVLNANQVVVRAAPILRYMLGWSRHHVRNYCARKHWKVEPL